MLTLQDLANTLEHIVDVAVAPRGLDVEVHDLLLYDAADRVDARRGDVVLGAGISSQGEAVRVVAELAANGAAGLLLKFPGLDDESVVDAAQEAGLAVLSVPRGASWSQVLLLIQSLLPRAAFGGDQEVRGVPVGDLFALAESVATLIGAPITIEDHMSRVIAYSGGQDEADDVRVETVLGRHVSDEIIAALEEQGIFRRLARESGAIYIEEIRPGMVPRLAIAVRAGDEVLGSMWAAIKQPPDPERQRAFEDAAKFAALHLLRHRTGIDADRAMQSDLLGAVLQGTSAAADAAERLGLQNDGFRVLALWTGGRDEADTERALSQLADVVAMHLATFHTAGAAAPFGGLVYTLVAVGSVGDEAVQAVTKLAEDLVERSSSGLNESLFVAIGGHAARIGDVPRSRREAEEALRVLRRRGADRVATIDDVRVPALLTRFAEVAENERDIYEGRIRVLIDSDRQQGTAYIESLTAYFDAFGDFAQAGQTLHVHPNTLRYRIRKAQDLAGIRLEDPDERLALMLLISMLRGI